MTTALRALACLLACLLAGYLALLGPAASAASPASAAPVDPAQPVKIIFDTDLGNDVDDVLALGMIHTLQTRGLCDLLAVTVTKDHPLAAAFIDAINTFYGRPNVPIGTVRKGPTPGVHRMLQLAQARDGETLRYPHDLRSGADAPEATALLRQILAGQPDQSVVLIQVGFSTNFARLLDTEGDEHSPLAGRELVAKKVKLLSVMAGAFTPINGKAYPEYNVKVDIPAAKKLYHHWPTPIVFSGYEIGIAVPYPATSIERDYQYVPHHPLAEAYHLYNPPPHNRPTWDLTSVIHVIWPEKYFALSPAGRVTVADDGVTHFEKSDAGPHRYLILKPDQVDAFTKLMVDLCTAKPGK